MSAGSPLRRGKKPRRKLVFMTFSGEEEGLIGSAYYVKNPVFPLNKTIAMINLDMVGRLKDDKLTIYGIGTAPHWEKLLKKLAPTHQLHLILKPEGFGPSDQSSFYGKKIPVLHFFTGTHPDHHRPTDKVAQDQHHGHGPRRRPGRVDRGRHRRKPDPAAIRRSERERLR